MRARTYTVLLLAALAWSACALGGELRRADALLALVGAALALMLSAAGPTRRGPLLVAFALCFVGLGAERANRDGPRARTDPLAGRIAEVAKTEHGWRIALRAKGAGEVPVWVRSTGLSWLDESIDGLEPGTRVRVASRHRASGSRVALPAAACLERLDAPRWVDRVGRGPRWVRAAFQRRARRRLLGLGDADAGALLLAMVAGDRRALRDGLTADLRASGLAHVAVVSGMHIGLLVSLVAGAACALLGRRSRRSALLVIAGLLVAVLILEPSPPVARAALAIGVAACARLVARGAAPPTAIGVALVVILALAPGQARSWSLLLSATAAVALVLAARGGFRPRFPVVLVAPFLATWPLLVTMTQRASPWSPVANLLVVPATPIALLAGWCRVILPDGPTAAFAGDAAALGAGWLVGVAHAVGHWPGSGALAADLGPWWVVAHGALLALFLGAWRGRWVWGAALAVCTTLPLWPTTPPGAGVRVFDVGQGQAVLLVEQGRCLLVDAADDRDPAGLRRLLRELRRLGVRRLEALVVSHADRDHAGGAAPLLRALRPDALVLPAAARGEERIRSLMAAASRQGIPSRLLSAGDTIAPPGPRCSVLGPVAGRRCDGNESSLILLCEAGGVRALLPGDAERAQELDALARLPAKGLGVDVVVAGHHGSRHSTSSALLRALDPTLVAVSCARGNRFAHPHRETLARIRRARAALWITAEMGDLLVVGLPSGVAWGGDEPCQTTRSGLGMKQRTRIKAARAVSNQRVGPRGRASSGTGG